MGRKKNTFVGSDERKPQDRSLTRPGAHRLALLHPRIPQNTGSIARLCAATGSRLELIRPLFEIDDRRLIRAGLDYWPLLDVKVFSSFEEWLDQEFQKPFWMVELGSRRLYTDPQYSEGETFLFGDEQDGIPESLLKKYPKQHIQLPQQGVRSLNLAMSVGIVTYEAYRQINWRGTDTL